MANWGGHEIEKRKASAYRSRVGGSAIKAHAFNGIALAAPDDPGGALKNKTDRAVLAGTYNAWHEMWQDIKHLDGGRLVFHALYRASPDVQANVDSRERFKERNADRSVLEPAGLLGASVLGAAVYTASHAVQSRTDHTPAEQERENQSGCMRGRQPAR